MIVVYMMPNMCFDCIYLNYSLQQKLSFFSQQCTKWIQAQQENFASDMIFNVTAVINLSPEIHSIPY